MARAQVTRASIVDDRHASHALDRIRAMWEERNRVPMADRTMHWLEFLSQIRHFLRYGEEALERLPVLGQRKAKR